ncbi:hypothetical protein B9W62_25265 [Streptomyces sp. CS113]|uniref:hypothetical protein n=1 Tax=Streptomyces sp. CS113 TaxID=1982761 RepID=UPI000B40B116|nr:hypothetical protein [Streptomyces sp. CS113]OWA03612.1 hypothetical protein B9W62_25265 [Streptomyces sp. CS113]
MTVPHELRLLPWTGPEGKPCYLSTDDEGGYLSRLADNVKAAQLGTAAELVERASEIINEQEVAVEELRHLAKDLAGALRDVVRVATSRGHLLAVNEPRGPST